MIILEKDKIEYQEANALLRNYNSVSWISCSIFFSSAFAILGLTWQVKEQSLLILLATTSVALYVIGFLIRKRFLFYSENIFERLWELEEQMGLNLHLLIKKRDEEATQESRIIHSLSKVRYLQVIILVVLLFFWALRISLISFF